MKLPVQSIKNKVLSIKYVEVKNRISEAKYQILNTKYKDFLPSKKSFRQGVRDFRRLKIAEKAGVLLYIFVFLFTSFGPYLPNTKYQIPNTTVDLTQMPQFENGEKVAEGVWKNPPNAG